MIVPSESFAAFNHSKESVYCFVPDVIDDKTRRLSFFPFLFNINLGLSIICHDGYDALCQKGVYISIGCFADMGPFVDTCSG